MHGEDPCPDCKPLCRYPGRRMRGASPATFFPRCYDLGDAGGRRAFEAAFRSAAAASLLRRLLADGCFSPTGDLLCCAPVPVNSDLRPGTSRHAAQWRHTPRIPHHYLRVQLDTTQPPSPIHIHLSRALMLKTPRGGPALLSTQ